MLLYLFPSSRWAGPAARSLPTIQSMDPLPTILPPSRHHRNCCPPSPGALAPSSHLPRQLPPSPDVSPRRFSTASRRPSPDPPPTSLFCCWRLAAFLAVGVDLLLLLESGCLPSRRCCTCWMLLESGCCCSLAAFLLPVLLAATRFAPLK